MGGAQRDAAEEVPPLSVAALESEATAGGEPMKPTPVLTTKPIPRAVRSDPKCSNEYCESSAEFTLLNGEDVQPFCKDCLCATVGEMVYENEDCRFFWDDAHKTVNVD